MGGGVLTQFQILVREMGGLDTVPDFGEGDGGSGHRSRFWGRGWGVLTPFQILVKGMGGS